MNQRESQVQETLDFYSKYFWFNGTRDLIRSIRQTEAQFYKFFYQKLFRV